MLPEDNRIWLFLSLFVLQTIPLPVLPISSHFLDMSRVNSVQFKGSLLA